MRERLKIKYDSNINLTCYKWYDPSIKPQAIIQLSHGMAEHILRYDHFANYLVNHGFYVIGFDHVAHGESCDDLKAIGVINDSDFITTMINGMKLVHDEFLDFYSQLPRYLFAHSMSSMAAQRYIQIYPDDFNKVILSGTDIGSIKYSFAKWLTKAIMFVKGPLSYSKLLDKLTIGGFARQFKNEHPRLGWLSSKTEEVKAYEENPLCGALFPTNYFHSLAKTLLEANKPRNIKLISKEIKILLICGSLDPVANKSKSVARLQKRYRKYSINSKKIVYHQGRHELINELDEIKNRVYEDIKTFYETP